VSSPTRVRIAAVSLLAAGALLLSACANNTKSSGSTQSTSGGSSTSVPPAVKDAALAAMVPAALQSAGTLQVGTDPTYAPNEYKDPSGKIVGFDVDLFDAVATTMGLKANFVDSTFDNIIPGITGGKYQVGVSSFTDSLAREKVVDFVTYYSAGIQWAAPAGKTVDPNNACGLKVAVQTGTVEVDDLNTRSKACTSAGKPAINLQKFPAQGDATTAVALGKVDAMSADSPVTEAAVKATGTKLQLVGSIYESAPYGYAVGKSEGQLKQAIQGSVQKLIDNGNYNAICEKWGLTAGEIKTSQINAATS
jgi:polar amino acid transport system substrate-binding protein